MRRATCPRCGQQARVNASRQVMVHSAPKPVAGQRSGGNFYKDGRACQGTGRIAVELRKHHQ